MNNEEISVRIRELNKEKTNILLDMHNAKSYGDNDKWWQLYQRYRDAISKINELHRLKEL